MNFSTEFRSLFLGFLTSPFFSFQLPSLISALNNSFSYYHHAFSLHPSSVYSFSIFLFPLFVMFVSSVSCVRSRFPLLSHKFICFIYIFLYPRPAPLPLISSFSLFLFFCTLFSSLFLCPSLSLTLFNYSLPIFYFLDFHVSRI